MRFVNLKWSVFTGMLSVLAVLLVACGGGAGGVEDAAGANQAPDQIANVEAKVISFLQLNDLHAHLTSHTDVDVIDGKKVYVQRGGLARMATLINAVRDKNPNTVLMNIGDTYHGGVEAMYTFGNAIVDPVNALGIDVGVPGNWDFAYGPSVTRARYTGEAVILPDGVKEIKRPSFPNLAANVTYKFPPSRSGEPFLPATWKKSIAGTQVGFIGLTSDIVPRMSEALAVGLQFLQAENDYISLIESLSDRLKLEGASIVVVMSELGIHKDFKLANEIKENSVDAFFSAHTHEITHEPLVSDSGAWVVEAGNDAYLGQLDMTIENQKVIERNWRLLTVDSTVDENPQVKRLVDEARAPFLTATVDMNLQGTGSTLSLNQPIDTVVAYQPQGLDRRHSLVNRFNHSYSEYLRQYSQSAVAMTPGFRYDAVIAPQAGEYEDQAIVAGNVTIEDAYRFFPVPFTLATADVSGARLREVIESNLTAVYSADIFKQSGGWFDGYAGIEITVDLSAADGARVMNIKDANGAEIQDGDMLSIAGCSRPFDLASETTLCSYSGFSNVKDLINPQTGLAWSGVDFLISGLQQAMLGAATVDNNVIDINSTPLWPAGLYWQPLRGIN